MIISAVVIVFYTSFGGFSAASTTDFIQGIVMTIALFIVFGFGIAVAAVPAQWWTTPPLSRAIWT